MSSKTVTCILRNSGNGWGQIDGNHPSQGVDHIEQTSECVKVYYNFTAQKVHYFNTDIDETFLLDDIRCGMSVGATYASIYFKKIGQNGYLNPANVSAEWGNIQVKIECD